MGREDILSTKEFERALHEYTQTHFPHWWEPAKQKMLRSHQAALTLIEPTREDAFVLDDPDGARRLLEEALPHLPEELAERVRQYLEG